MTAFKAKVDKNRREDPSKTRVVIMAGRDTDHYQFAGIIILKPEEVEEFLALVNRGG